MINAVPSFKEIIHTALKNPDADYGVSGRVYTLPVGETRQSSALAKIKEKKTTGRHIVMGFGGLFTFDLAVASHSPPEGTLLCDINTKQGAFWDAFFELVKECDTSDKLRKRFMALPQERGDLEIDLPPRLRPKVGGKVSLRWIYKEDEYQAVRSMILQGKVAHITLDCMDENRYGALKKVLDDNGYAVSALYLSNIFNFFQRSPEGFHHQPTQFTSQEIKKNFWRNQLMLCNDDTYILNAEPGDEMNFNLKTYQKPMIEGRFLNA